MNNVMIDIETMGLPPEAPICSIGAAYFDPKTGEVGQQFYARVEWQPEGVQGVPSLKSTVDWWDKQDKAAAGEIFGGGNRMPLVLALCDLGRFLNGPCNKDLQVWANGDDFDCVLLESAYRREGIEVPWMFWGTRDARTLVQIVRDLRGVEVNKRAFVGEKHHALHDVLHQIAYVSEGYSLL